MKKKKKTADFNGTMQKVCKFSGIISPVFKATKRTVETMINEKIVHIRLTACGMPGMPKRMLA